MSFIQLTSNVRQISFGKLRRIIIKALRVADSDNILLPTPASVPTTMRDRVNIPKPLTSRRHFCINIVTHHPVPFYVRKGHLLCNVYTVFLRERLMLIISHTDMVDCYTTSHISAHARIPLSTPGQNLDPNLEGLLCREKGGCF